MLRTAIDTRFAGLIFSLARLVFQHMPCVPTDALITGVLLFLDAILDLFLQSKMRAYLPSPGSATNGKVWPEWLRVPQVGSMLFFLACTRRVVPRL